MEMTKKVMALAFALAAPAAFGQTSMTATNRTAVPVNILRQEIKRDKGDLTAKVKAERAELKQLLVQEQAELAKVAKSVGTRAEKKAARQALRSKYAQLLKAEHEKGSYEKKNLRQDMSSKQGQIKKLRQ